METSASFSLAGAAHIESTRRRARPAPAWVVAGGVVVALLAVLPLILLLSQAASLGWARIQPLLIRPLVGELLVNTALLTVTATIAASVLGLGVAWCVERTDLPGARVWGLIAGLPLTVPAFVTSYSWVSLTPAVQGFAGAVLVLVLAYYPLVYLPVAAVLRGMDPALEENARSLGLSPSRTFLRVILPQARPALFGGGLIVAIHLLAEFGAFAMLRFRTFTTVIYDEYRLSFSGPAAAMLSTVLVGLCVALLLLELRVRGGSHYTRVGRGTARPVGRLRLGWATPVVLLAFVVLLSAALGLPLGTLVYWLTRASAAFTAADLLGAAATSLGLSAGAAALTTVLALPIAILAVRYPGRLATALERSTYLASSLPGIAVALALVVVAVRFLRPFYQTTPLLLIAYAILFLPLALVSARAALAQASPAVEELARSLGCGPWATFRRVTLPLIAPGLGSGAALVFLFAMTELPATLLLAPIGTQTLATQVWSNTRSLSYGAAAPFAGLMICLSILPTFVLTRKLSALTSSHA